MYQHSPYATSLYSALVYWMNHGAEDDFLDRHIAILRVIGLNRTKSNPTATTSFAISNIPSPGQEIYNKNLTTQPTNFGAILMNKDEEADKLLSEISRILNARCQPEYAAGLLSILRDEYRKTQNITTLRMALDNHLDIDLRKSGVS